MIQTRNYELTEHDYEFLTDMMYESIHIPENKPLKHELLSSSHIKKYVEDWGRTSDEAIFAIDDENNNPIGAAWFRLFTEDDKGYGYIDEQTPELGIAIINEARGRGVGTLLMKSLIEKASNNGYPALSLSVDPKNIQAVELYKKLGFVYYGISGTSWTMVYRIITR